MSKRYHNYPKVNDPEWFLRAVCNPVNATNENNIDWVPDKPTQKTDRQAFAVCAVCPVRRDCLVSDFYESLPLGLTHGVRGGMSARERMALFVEWEPLYKTPTKRKRASGE